MRAVHLQDEEADVLPEADVTMVARSISASLGILQEDHAALLLPFLQQSGLHQVQTVVTHESSINHYEGTLMKGRITHHRVIGTAPSG